MDFLRAMLIGLLQSEKLCVSFPALESSLLELVEAKSYQALSAIKGILDDESLSDEDCFLKIEAILKVFEALGCDCGGRHDFG